MCLMSFRVSAHLSVQVVNWHNFSVYGDLRTPGRSALSPGAWPRIHVWVSNTAMGMNSTCIHIHVIKNSVNSALGVSIFLSEDIHYHDHHRRHTRSVRASWFDVNCLVMMSIGKLSHFSFCSPRSVCCYEHAEHVGNSYSDLLQTSCCETRLRPVNTVTRSLTVMSCADILCVRVEVLRTDTARTSHWIRFSTDPICICIDV